MACSMGNITDAIILYVHIHRKNAGAKKYYTLIRNKEFFSLAILTQSAAVGVKTRLHVSLF